MKLSTFYLTGQHVEMEAKKKKTFWEKLVMPVLTPKTPVMITVTILMKFYRVQVLCHTRGGMVTVMVKGVDVGEIVITHIR